MVDSIVWVSVGSNMRYLGRLDDGIKICRFGTWTVPDRLVQC